MRNWAGFREFCEEWLEIDDYDELDDEAKNAAYETYCSLSEYDDKARERYWIYPFESPQVQQAILAFQEEYGSGREDVYDVTFTRSSPTVTYGINALSAAQARKIANKLFDAPVFRGRLEHDFDNAHGARVISLLTVAPGDTVTLSQEQVHRYLNGIPRPVTMTVTLQRDGFHGYLDWAGEISFDCAPALDALYRVDELPLSYDDLHGSDRWNYGDDLFHQAESMHLCDEWDGPFEAYLEDDYQVYLGARLLSELGSVDAVTSWLSDRCGMDLRQTPRDEVPDEVNETLDAAESLAARVRGDRGDAAR